MIYKGAMNYTFAFPLIQEYHPTQIFNMMLVTLTLAILCMSAHASSLLKKDTENVMVRRLSTHYDRVHRSTHYDRVQRSIGCDFPLLLRFQFDINDVNIYLNLERNNHIHNDVPIYVPGENGEAVREEITDDQEFTLYQDINQGSAMLVSCEYDATYKLQGSFRYKDVLYHMSPSNQPVVSSDHTILQTHRDTVAYGLDAILPPGSAHTQSYSTMNSTSRTKRAMAEENVIELVFAVDNSTYQYYLNEQGTKAAAERAIRRHVTMLANEAAIFYSSIPSLDATVNIRIFVSGIFIDDNSGLSDWSSTNHVTINGKGYLSYDNLMLSIKNWHQNLRGLPAHDHLMALSLLEFAVIRSGVAINKGLTGVAYVGTVCSFPSWSVSFTQVEFNGRTAQTIAHELGHAISAQHDGTGNICSRRGNNVMTPVFSVTTSSRYASSQWTFSTCSVNYFKDHLNSLAPGNHCMLQHSFNDVDYWLDTYGLPGDYYSINEQCTMYEGVASTTCSYSDFVSESSCHSGIHCSDVVYGCLGSYYPLYPLTGTKCGNASGTKICYKGQCTTRASAPSTKSSTSSTSTSATSATSNSSTTPSTTTSTQSTTTTTSTTPSTTTSTQSTTTTTSSTPSTTTSTQSTTTTTSTTPSTTTSTPSTTTTTSTTPSTTTSTQSTTTTTSSTPSTTTSTQSTTTTTSTTPSTTTSTPSTTSSTSTTPSTTTSTPSTTSSTSTTPSTTTSTPSTTSSTSTTPSTTTCTPSTTTSASTTTTLAVCTRKRCCERVKVGKRLRRKCCKGLKCCRPSKKWSSGTECYRTCCTSQSNSTTM